MANAALWTALEAKFSKLVQSPLPKILDKLVFYILLYSNTPTAARKTIVWLTDSEEFGDWLEVKAATCRELTQTFKNKGIHNPQETASYLLYLLDQIWEFFDDCSLEIPNQITPDFLEAREQFLNRTAWKPQWALTYLKGLWGITEAIPWDPHTDRISGRLGITENNAQLTERKTALKILRGDRSPIESYKLFVALGQTTCVIGQPRCQVCPINNFCKTGQNQNTQAV